MPLYKSAQATISIDELEDLAGKDDVVLYEEKPSPEDVIEMHKPNEAQEIVFKLAPLPGSDVQELEVSTDDPIEVEDKSDTKDEKPLEVADPWNWHSGGDVLGWVKERFNSIPKHTGRETAGIERAIAYLKRINSEMSKAAAGDYDGKIDISKFEEARKEIYSAIERLEDAKEKLEETHYKKKKGSKESELVKEAQKTTAVGGIIVTVPLIISSIARMCINGTISAGHDLEKLYAHAVKKYKLDDREQLELKQLLCDMNMPIKFDRGLMPDEKFDPKSSDNYDFASNYPA
jgi:hypothetical protein